MALVNNGLIIQWGKSKTFGTGEGGWEDQTLPITYKTRYTPSNVLAPEPISSVGSYCVSVAIINSSTLRCIHNVAISGYHLWITFGF